MTPCPRCGTPMDFNRQYNQWYCPNCLEYHPSNYSPYSRGPKPPRSKRKIVAIIVVISIIIISILLLLFIYNFYYSVESGLDFQTNTVDGQEHPEFVRKSADKAPVFISFIQNDENCPPCKRMRPVLDQLKEDYHKDVIFYTININENEMTRYYKSDEKVDSISNSEKNEIYGVYDTGNIAGGLVATPTYVIIMKENSELKFAVSYGEFENDDADDTGEELEKTIKYALSKY
jgi:thiol-disulfide isomerase/thioredoxin